ncbi:hypothetical protein ACFPT7_21675 [Acidicapsa dinghuensis]|uniref:DUF3455 domain-containing protein n=1 Tax=Acidicapsa dinghuensis TaxID=2218256 RepID=A0ABW1ELH3_9BACT|nr:hypothetical protein [Acidicapsa dinghuensis]
MRKTAIKVVASALAVLMFLSCQQSARAQAGKTSYPTMAPLDQYLIPDESVEIALARSAAPPSVSDAAEVMVLHRDGYTTAAKGSNGFVCIVERSWATTTDDAQFWNPNIRAPHCFNAPAAETVLPIFLMKTKLVLAGKSKAEIVSALTSAFEDKELPALATGTVVYMMSKQQYLNDEGKNWHPHVMFYASGDAGKSSGANLPGSPVMAGYDAEQRLTTFFILATK